jgi:hypothetical protein
MKGQALLDLQAVNKKCVDLAAALPSDKLTWRPPSDTRSFAEVFPHVAGERYGILSMMGANPPAVFKAHEFEKSTTEKDRIVEDLNQSWDFANKTIIGMSNSDFAKPLSSLSCTRIVIAHRLSTIRDADLILVVNAGRIVESGRHDELLGLGNAYYELIAAQRDGTFPVSNKASH